MNTDLKAEWVKRLRSGDIKKSKYYLCDDDGSMCVFGVLCEIMVERGEVKKRVVKTEIGRTHTEYDGCVSIPPRSVTSAAGGRLVKFLDMNDTKSFKKIADYIEREL